MSDLMKRLSAADPARRADLDSVDGAAFAALREEITMTSTRGATAPALPADGDPVRRRRRLGRRGSVAIGLAAVLTGGGVAYAAIQMFQGSSGEGVTCVHAWNEDTAEGLDIDATGSWITGDPYADCATLLADEGLPPIEDPVAFAWDGQTIVAPADQVPEGVQRLEGPQAVESGVVELQRSVIDPVDGGWSECRSVAEGAAWAQGEIDRLGLQDWTVIPQEAGGTSPSCSTVEINVGERTVTVSPSDDPYQALSTPEADAMIDALRDQVVDGCLFLDAAGAVVDEAVAPFDVEVPTTDMADESAECARVDVFLGGTVKVTVYGPSAAD
ncbi:hypothetical protein [Krasilnikoviella flava]|uniref:Uncharacterized protein n=1 Tax=Krasilnikoviella flava TaxID=526729 RepID=A0A1T5IS01_9MICO|nr:hypothetical protein [Krasilnikoviella flava]SKC41939.1 hypothetical protein SAMN04324258_0864 [Krasilnikoviella flava]